MYSKNGRQMARLHSPATLSPADLVRLLLAGAQPLRMRDKNSNYAIMSAAASGEASQPVRSPSHAATWPGRTAALAFPPLRVWR